MRRKKLKMLKKTENAKKEAKRAQDEIIQVGKEFEAILVALQKEDEEYQAVFNKEK